MNKIIKQIFLAIVLFYQPAIVAMKEERNEKQTPDQLSLFVETIKLDINKQFEDGKTLLHYALLNRDYQLALFLLNLDANPKIEDKKGVTPKSLLDLLFKTSLVKHELIPLRKILNQKCKAIPQKNLSEIWNLIEVKDEYPKFIESSYLYAPPHYNRPVDIIIIAIIPEQQRECEESKTITIQTLAKYYGNYSKKKQNVIKFFYCVFNKLSPEKREKLGIKIANWLNKTDSCKNTKIIFCGLRHGCTIINEILWNLIPYYEKNNKIKERVSSLLYLAPPYCHKTLSDTSSMLFDSIYNKLEESHSEKKPINFKKLYIFYSPNDTESKSEGINKNTESIARVNIASSLILSHGLLNIALFFTLQKTLNKVSRIDNKFLKQFFNLCPQQSLYLTIPAISRYMHQICTERAELALQFQEIKYWYDQNGLKVISGQNEQQLEKKINAFLAIMEQEIINQIDKNEQYKEQLIPLMEQCSFRGPTIVSKIFLNNKLPSSSDMTKLLPLLSSVIKEIEEEYPVNCSLGGKFSIDINFPLYKQSRNDYLSCVLDECNTDQMNSENKYLNKTLKKQHLDFLEQKSEEDNYSKTILSMRKINYKPNSIQKSNCILL